MLNYTAAQTDQINLIINIISSWLWQYECNNQPEQKYESDPTNFELTKQLAQLTLLMTTKMKQTEHRT